MTETDRHLADIRVLVAAARERAPLPADRLAALAHRYLASSREGRGRIDPGVYAETIRGELTGRFVRQGREPDRTQATRMLAAALRRAAADIADRTHFIPCRLFGDAGPVGLAVGPVVFRPAAGFRDAHGDAIAADPHCAAVVEHEFAPWGWAAEVTVRGCDTTVSRERALLAVDGALDMLRLHAGAARAGALGRAGAPGLPVAASGIWADSTGRLHAAAVAAAPCADAGVLLQEFHAGDGRDWIDRAGETLRPLADPSLSWPLAARFREAASWYGRGVAESYVAARIADFVTAIERAVVAGEHADLWRTVTRRAAILAAAAEGGDIAAWRRRAKAIYEMRSQLVHGVLSPFAPEAAEAAPTAAALARAALRGTLSFFETLGLRRARFSADRLDAEFGKLESTRRTD